MEREQEQERVLNTNPLIHSKWINDEGTDKRVRRDEMWMFWNTHKINTTHCCSNANSAHRVIVFEFAKACTDKHFNCFSISCLHCVPFFFLYVFVLFTFLLGMDLWHLISSSSYFMVSPLNKAINALIIHFVSGKIIIKFARKMSTLCAPLRMAVNFVYLLLFI